MNRRQVRATDRSRHLDKEYVEAQTWLRAGIQRRPAGPSKADVPAEIKRSLDANGYTGSDEDDEEDKPK